MLVCIDRDPPRRSASRPFSREVECETRFMRMDYATLSAVLEEGVRADMAYLDSDCPRCRSTPGSAALLLLRRALDMRMDPTRSSTRAVVKSGLSPPLQLFIVLRRERFSR